MKNLTFRALSALGTAVGGNKVKVIAGDRTCCWEESCGSWIISVGVSPNMTEREKMLIDGYLDHESGHVRFTQTSDTAVSIAMGVKGLYNTVEDIRIELAIGIQFPGAAINLNRMVQVLCENEDFWCFPKKGMRLKNLVEMLFLYGGRAIYLRQAAMASRTNETLERLKKRLSNERLTELNALFKRLGKLSSSSASVTLAADIASFIKEVEEEEKQQQQQRQQQQQQQDDSDDDTDGDSDDDANGDSDDDANGDSDDDANGDSNDDANGDSDDDANGDSDDDANGDSDDDANGDSDDDTDGDSDDDANGDSDDDANGDSDDDANGDSDDDANGDSDDDANGDSDDDTDGDSDDDANGDSDDDANGDSDDDANGDSDDDEYGDTVVELPAIEDAIKQILDGMVSEYVKECGNNPYSSALPVDKAGVDAVSARNGRTQLSTQPDAKTTQSIQSSFKKWAKGFTKTSHSLRDNGSKLRSSRLAGVPTGNFRVFERTARQCAPTAAVTILLDTSSSMAYPPAAGLPACYGAANSACASMADALQSLPGFAVSVFQYAFELWLVKSFESNTKVRNLIPPIGGTATYESILGALPQLMARKETNKVMIVLTDGDTWVSDAMDHARQSGVKLGFVRFSDATSLLVNVPPELQPYCSDLNDLPSVMASLIQQIMSGL